MTRYNDVNANSKHFSQTSARKNGNYYLELLVSIYSTQYIKQLSFILMNTLDLYIKETVRVNGYTSYIINILHKPLFAS